MTHTKSPAVSLRSLARGATNASLLRALARGALIVATLALGACVYEDSSTVDQDRIHTEYWLAYDTNADATYVRAIFRHGSRIGTVLGLGGGAEITFDGRPLGWNEAWRWHELVLPGRIDGGRYVYVDTEGRRFENVVELARDIDFPEGIDTLSQSTSSEIAWLGATLGEGESMDVWLYSPRLVDGVRTESRNVGATSVVLRRDEIARVGLGAARLSMRRYHESTPQQAPEAGGRVVGQFEPRILDVTVVP